MIKGCKGERINGKERDLKSDVVLVEKGKLIHNSLLGYHTHPPSSLAATGLTLPLQCVTCDLSPSAPKGKGR